MLSPVRNINITNSRCRSVTLTEAMALIEAGAISPADGLKCGVIYKITEVDQYLYDNTTTIWLRALSPTVLSPSGIGLFYTPKYNNAVAGREIFNPTSEWTLSNVTGDFGYEELVTADNSATGKLYGKTLTKFVPLTGDWTTAASITGDGSGATADIDSITLASFSIGQKVHWGGKTWENVNGEIGMATDIYTLDSEWSALPYNNIDYNIRYDVIKYNIVEDYICYREDLAGNKIEKNTKDYVSLFGLPDPIKSFQWGNEFDASAGYGVGNITVRGLSCCENINFRGRFQNNLTFDNSSIQYNLTFDNSSTQFNLTFDNSSIQYNLTFDNNSSQSNLTFNGDSGQSNLTFNNSSSQSYLTFNGGSSQDNLTFDNSSHQSNLTFNGGSNQSRLTFDNGGIQYNLTFTNNSQQSSLTAIAAENQQNIWFSNTTQISGLTLPAVMQNCIFNGNVYAGTDLSAATVIQDNSTKMFMRASGTGNEFMQYIDGSGSFIATGSITD